MISIENYRVAIGNFNSKLQLSLKPSVKGMKIRSRGSECDVLPIYKGQAKGVSLFLSNIPGFYSLLLCVGMILIIAGDIELNPGPIYPDKIICGSFHQGNPRFGESAGKQCVCNAVWSLCYSLVKNLRYWSTWDLDLILTLGNELYNAHGFTDYVSFEEIPSEINYKNSKFQIEKRELKTGILNLTSSDFLINNRNTTGSIFITTGLGSAIFSINGDAYIFDSHSRDPITGLLAANGTSVLMKFKCLMDAETYIKNFYLTRETPSVFYGLLYIHITMDSDNINLVRKQIKNEKERTTRKRKRESQSENVTPEAKGTPIVAGGIELNPGPFYPDKIICGSFHQGVPRFGESAGKQCVCNAVWSLCYSLVKNLRYWSTWDLDLILTSGNKLYNAHGFTDYVSFEEIPSEINYKDSTFQIEKLELKTGILNLTSSDFLISNTNTTGSIFITAGLGSAIFSNNGDAYIFDPHSRDSITGLLAASGTSVLMKFKCLMDAETYIKNFYLTRETPSVFYGLLYIQITMDSDSINLVRKQIRNEKERTTRKRKRESQSEHVTPEAKGTPRDKTRIRAQRFRDNMTADAKAKHREKTRTRMQQYRNRVNQTSQKKNIEKFKNTVRQGPYFICVVCNRQLYQQSVQIFDENKYNVDSVIFSFRVASDCGREYICLTCHQKLLKRKIPCQAVINDLQIFELPDNFSKLRKLEKTIIAKRILFKKVTIMPKGQAPKMKGTICNVPIRADDICNVLPRGMDNNGVVQVALKKRMNFKSNVLFETVRPEIVEEILVYLKNNNKLYSDIEINLNNVPQNWVGQIDNSTDEETEVHFVNEEQIPKVKHFEEEDMNPLDTFRITASETVYVPELAFEVIDNGNINIAPGENQLPLPIILDDDCELLAHPWLFPTGKFGYTYERDEKLSPCKYFNQRLLNYTQKFASDTDYIFFAQSLLQHLNLNNSINIALKKVKSDGMTAGELSQNFKQKISEMIASDDAFNFMNVLKSTPAYWKRFLYEVLAMVKQLGLPTYFMTLSCADLRWNELVEIIGKLNSINLSTDDIGNLNYFERTKILNSNPVLLARHFQYRVENFFKYIILNGSLGKVIHYAIRVEFQVRGSPHVHCLLWVENAPTLSENERQFLSFIDNTVKCQLPKQEQNENLFDLVKIYQTHSHSRSCRKYKNVDCRYSFGKFFTNRTIIAEPIADVFSEEEKNNILRMRKHLLDQVQNYIDKNLNPKYRNMYDKNKENYDPPKSIEEILEDIGIEEIEYYGCLSTSHDKSYHIHFKRSPNSCFINNYFEDGLVAWEANLDIQPVIDYYAAVVYMCAYLSKTEDESTEAMKQAAKEALEQGKSAYERMKAVSKAYRTHREMSIQEAVSIILPKIWLRKTRPAVMFANTNLPENRYRICRNEEEIANMDESETNIFKRNMLDRYMDRPNATFMNGRYSIMESLFYAQFLSNYVLDTKSREEEQNDYQPEILEELLLEETNNRLPASVPLMSSKERLKLRKKKCVLRYHVPSHMTKPEAYAHHMLLMYYPFRNESDLNATPSGTYSEKMLQPGVLDVINANRQIIEPFGEIVENAFIHFNENNTRGLDPTGEQENDHVRDELDQTLNEEDEEEINESFCCGAPLNNPIRISDGELNEKIRSLNEKQREIFDLINQWARQTMQSLGVEGAPKPDQFNIFLTGSAGCGKSHLLTTIKLYLQKALSYNSNDSSLERMLMLAPTGVAAVNVDGSTIHSALGILPNQRSSIKCVSTLSDKKRSSLRQKYSELKVIVIDEISMVSNKLLLSIHQRLCDIFGCSTDHPFAGLSVIACGDFYQLPPIQQKPVFAEFNDHMLNIFHCWRNFKIAELTEVMRQRGDTVFIDLLNNVRTGSVTDKDMEILRSRQVSKDDPNYPDDAIHIWAENSLVTEHNEKKLNKLSGIQYDIESIDKFPENISESVLQQVYNRNQMDTGGLAHRFSIKMKAKVMLTSNLDVEDKLCNGQIGTVQHLKFDRDGNVITIYLKMDEGIGIKTTHKDSYGKVHNLVPINRIEKEIKIRKNSLSSPVLKRLQFPIVLSWACTVHKVQGKTFPQIVFGLNLVRQRRFNYGQVYVALSRVTSLAGLFILGEIEAKHITTDQRATAEYDYMRENSTIHYRDNILTHENEFSISLINIRSLSKHAADVKCDKRLMESDVICFTETQLTSEIDTTGISNILSPFQIHFNNLSNHKYSNIALAYRERVNLLNTISLPGASIFTLSKPSFSLHKLNILLLYRKNDMRLADFLYMILHLQSQIEQTVQIILGDFNVNGLQESANPLLEYLNRDYKLINHTSTHISGSLLDYIYVHKDYLESIKFDISLNHVYYSDHNSLRLKMTMVAEQAMEDE